MSEALARLAEHQHGVVSAAQARSLGISPGSLHQSRQTGLWESITDQVIRRVGAPTGRGQRVMVAVLDAGPGAALSHRSSASWWRVRGAAIEPIHAVRTSRSHRLSQVGAIIHTVRELPEAWLTLADGVPVVRPQFAALQLFATCRYGQAERWVETMWSLRLLDGRSLGRFLDEMGRSGRDGTAGVRRYLEPRGPGYVPAASGVETRVLQVFRSAGIEMRRQVDTGDEVHWTGRVDFCAVDVPLIVEVQSEFHHAALVDRESDERRLAALRAAGYTVVEVTDTEVWTTPAVVVDRVRAALQSLS